MCRPTTAASHSVSSWSGHRGDHDDRTTRAEAPGGLCVVRPLRVPAQRARLLRSRRCRRAAARRQRQRSRRARQGVRRRMAVSAGHRRGGGHAGRAGRRRRPQLLGRRARAGPRRPAALLERLRSAFKGQVTGLLSDLARPHGVLAHHSFHVFVVYPWVRFLDRDATTALQVLQDCRIRWGTVESVEDEHAVIDDASADIHRRHPGARRTDNRTGAVAQGRSIADRAARSRRRRVGALGLGLLAFSPTPSARRWPTRRRPRSIW